MAYGLEINGFAFTYGALSVISTGTINPGDQLIINKSAHPDISDWRVVFTPTGVRDVAVEEVRPTSGEIFGLVFMEAPSNASPHNFLVLGR